jgi:hypothetical protein
MEHDKKAVHPENISYRDAPVLADQALSFGRSQETDPFSAFRLSG